MLNDPTFNTETVIEAEMETPSAQEYPPEHQEAEPERSEEKWRKGGSTQFNQWFALFEQAPSVEAKIQLSIDFMKEALAHQGTPCFRDFWEGKRLCLPLFKENISPKVRSRLWGEYIELSGEARQIKDILEEQSAFAVEQIELAIQAVEKDIENYEALLSHVQEPHFLDYCQTLQPKSDVYIQLQKELYLLNTLASRMNALRKEVVKTEMRIRIKNKLFERLSLCGDHIFPRRKELIKIISQEFTQDIELFVSMHFGHDEVSAMPLYILREEIKELQSIAKILTLNTHSFTETRLKLSSSWDLLRNQEREHKKVVAQKKEGMRQIQEEENEKVRQENVIEMQRRELVVQFKEKLSSLISQIELALPDELLMQRDGLLKELEKLQLGKAEKQIIERQLKQFKDQINEKKEKNLMALSEDDLKSLEQLNAMLQERLERRAEIKMQLETYRKALGGSGFDFEKAMMYRELIEVEREILDKINISVSEIEEKITEIEG